MNRNSKKWLIGIGILFFFLVAWMVFRETPVAVETALVRRGEMTVTIDGEGKTRVHEKFIVTAPVAGKMSRLKVRQGDTVFKDSIITTVDPAPLTRPLPPSQTENFPDIYGVRVYAPANGKVLRVIEESERIIQAGTPILEVGNPENLEIVVDLLSSEAAQVRPGATMLIENWGGAQSLKARVRTVEPQAFTKISALGVDEQRVNIVADLLDKTIKLGDNYRVDARIIAWQAADVLKTDSSALFREGEKWKVFVNEGGAARLREVKIGHQTPSETEILSGLNEGETVILHPSNQIGEKTKIEAK